MVAFSFLILPVLISTNQPYSSIHKKVVYPPCSLPLIPSDHWIIKPKLGKLSIQCPFSHCVKFMIILPTMSKLLAPPSSHYIIDISSSSFHQASISFSLFVFHFSNLCPKCTFSVLSPYVCFSYWYIGLALGSTVWIEKTWMRVGVTRLAISFGFRVLAQADERLGIV